MIETECRIVCALKVTVHTIHSIWYSKGLAVQVMLAVEKMFTFSKNYLEQQPRYQCAIHVQIMKHSDAII